MLPVLHYYLFYFFSLFSVDEGSLKEILSVTLENIIQYFIRPEHYKLISRSV